MRVDHSAFFSVPAQWRTAPCSFLLRVKRTPSCFCLERPRACTKAASSASDQSSDSDGGSEKMWEFIVIFVWRSWAKKWRFCAAAVKQIMMTCQLKSTESSHSETGNAFSTIEKEIKIYPFFCCLFSTAGRRIKSSKQVNRFDNRRSYCIARCRHYTSYMYDT